MAKLSDTDKAQLRRAITSAGQKPPAPPLMSVRAFAEFATFASRFNRTRKPVRFAGQYWRL